MKKTICCNLAILNDRTIIQVIRGDKIKNHHPTRASWKRFINLALNDRLVTQKNSYRVLPSASYRK